MYLSNIKTIESSYHINYSKGKIKEVGDKEKKKNKRK